MRVVIAGNHNDVSTINAKSVFVGFWVFFIAGKAKITQEVEDILWMNDLVAIVDEGGIHLFS